MEAADTAALRVPADLAVVGYDDTPIASHPLIGLSSINQSGDMLGERAADALLERRAGRTSERHDLVTPRLVVRASSGRAFRARA